jgi:methionyl-tRNA synthetase
VDGRCPEHPNREITWAREENYFFRLSRYRDRVLQVLDAHPQFVQPEVRRNEIRNVLLEGLQDISASRARIPWGIPFPGAPDHTVYVWIDALINYLSAVGYPDASYREWWPARLHVVGKGVTRFHCIIWPAMLLSAGVELPHSVWAHGYITWGGEKISKTAGVAVTLDSAIERFGPDALRYFLLREVPWDGDGEFTWERFEERYIADLANDLGNLVHRTTHMIERYRHGRVPDAKDPALDEAAERAFERYRAAMDAYRLHDGLAAAFELVDAGNAFVEARAPWNLAKDSARARELDAVLGGLATTLGRLAILLTPFMPTKSEELWVAASGREGPPQTLDAFRELQLAGSRVRLGPVLFPKPPTAA